VIEVRDELRMAGDALSASTAGLHTFDVTFLLSDGSTTINTATWEVLASTEP
jgi:hypothetical protein